MKWALGAGVSWLSRNAGGGVSRVLPQAVCRRCGVDVRFRTRIDRLFDDFRRAPAAQVASMSAVSAAAMARTPTAAATMTGLVNLDGAAGIAGTCESRIRSARAKSSAL